MSRKLLKMFLLRERRFFLLFIAVFAIMGIHMMYCVLIVTSTYYRWEPVGKLGPDWYYYTGGSVEFDDVERYLQTNQGGVTMLEFMVLNCNYDRTEVMEENGIYSHGIIFQASGDELGCLLKEFPEAEKTVPVSEIVEKACSFDKMPGVYRVLVQIVISVMAVVSGVFWFWQALKKSREEREFLLYVGDTTNRLKKQCHNFLLCLLILLWLVSFVALWIPDPSANSLIYYENSVFWRIYPPVLLAMFGIGTIFIFVMLFLFHFLWKKETGREACRELDELHICVEDMSLRDNVRLIFWAQGFSDRMSEKYADDAMKEKEILYCASRPFCNVGKEEKVLFYDLRDELAGKRK